MKLSGALKHLGKIIGFAILIAIFSLVLGIYWELFKGDSADYKALREAVVQYGNDLNEMREYLYLPRNEYDFFSSDTSEITTDQPEERTEPYIMGISGFAKELVDSTTFSKKQSEAEVALNQLVNDTGFLTELEKLSLDVSSPFEVTEEYISVKIMNGWTPLAQIMMKVDDGKIGIQSIIGKDDIQALEEETVSEKIIDYLRLKKEEIIAMQQTLNIKKSALENFLTETAVNSILQQNQLTINIPAIETPAGFETYITDTDGSPLLTLILNRRTGTFQIGETMYENIDALREPFVQKLETLNGESDYVKEIKAKKQALETYLKSDEIKVIFNNTSIQTQEGRESEGRMYYDIVYKEGETEQILGSIIFDEATGNISFLRSGDSEEIPLEELLSGSKKKP